MSTDIKTIKGRFESHNTSRPLHAKYKKSEISLCRFYGGKMNGVMIHLTISNNEGYTHIQLTQSQVKELAKTLKHVFNYDRYPSD